MCSRRWFLFALKIINRVFLIYHTLGMKNFEGMTNSKKTIIRAVLASLKKL